MVVVTLSASLWFDFVLCCFSFDFSSFSSHPFFSLSLLPTFFSLLSFCRRRWWKTRLENLVACRALHDPVIYWYEKNFLLPPLFRTFLSFTRVMNDSHISYLFSLKKNISYLEPVLQISWFHYIHHWFHYIHLFFKRRILLKIIMNLKHVGRILWML